MIMTPTIGPSMPPTLIRNRLAIECTTTVIRESRDSRTGEVVVYDERNRPSSTSDGHPDLEDEIMSERRDMNPASIA